MIDSGQVQSDPKAGPFTEFIFGQIGLTSSGNGRYSSAVKKIWSDWIK